MYAEVWFFMHEFGNLSVGKWKLFVVNFFKFLLNFSFLVMLLILCIMTEQNVSMERTLFWKGWVTLHSCSLIKASAVPMRPWCAAYSPDSFVSTQFKQMSRLIEVFTGHTVTIWYLDCIISKTCSCSFVFFSVFFRYKIFAHSLYHWTDNWTAIIWNLFKWDVHAERYRARQLRNSTWDNASLGMCQSCPVEAGIQFHGGSGG